MKTNRIEVVDALRGLAVFGILMIHNLEHNGLYFFPRFYPSLTDIDKIVWDSFDWLFAGKAYAMFALLFGFSYWIQYSNQVKRGGDFAGRFAWRMVILFAFGWINATFFPGDVLMIYAVLGIFLIPMRRWGNRPLLIAMVIFLLQPIELAKVIYSLYNPEYVQTWWYRSFYAPLTEVLKSGNIIDTFKANWTDGVAYCVTWTLQVGRFSQILGLFTMGFLLGKNNKFSYSDSNIRFWKRILLFSIVYVAAFIAFDNFKYTLPTTDENWFKQLNTLINMWKNLGTMALIVSSFILLYHTKRGESVLSYLAPYGRMSLTNYITQSFIGFWIYFEAGFGLWKLFGTTFSAMTGLLIFWFQSEFCRWWFTRHTHGPLEGVWKRLTWIKIK
ncbi:MAG: DUF418 domain-containing protein [Bacteroidales bacterium]